MKRSAALVLAAVLVAMHGLSQAQQADATPPGGIAQATTARSTTAQASTAQASTAQASTDPPTTAQTARPATAAEAIAAAEAAVKADPAKGELYRPDWLPRGDHIYTQFGFYTAHWNDNPEHVAHNKMVNLEYQRQGAPFLADTGHHLVGYAWFYNSFGQPSWYVYYGRQWDLSPWIPYSYFKLTGGLVHGYKDKYEDKIPFNNNGYAPGIVPSFGVRYYGFAIEAIILGNAGMMFSAGYRF